MNPPTVIRRRIQQTEISYEPIQSAFTVDLNSVHIPGTDVSFFRVIPFNPDDSASDTMLERIVDRRIERDNSWVDHWAHIQQLEKLVIQGFLRYYACYINKSQDSDGDNILMITEYADSSLRTKQMSSCPLQLLDLIQMLVQVNSTLCELEKFGYSHQSINPETLLIKSLADGSVCYKLASSISLINLSGGKYDEKTEYFLYIAPDHSLHLQDIKNDVYSLGMVFLESVGVSEHTLAKIKSGTANYLPERYDNSVITELAQLMLQAVHPDYTRRLSPKVFRNRLTPLLAQMNAISNFSRKNFVDIFEEMATSTGSNRKNGKQRQKQNHELVQFSVHSPDPVSQYHAGNYERVSPSGHSCLSRACPCLAKRWNKGTLQFAFCLASAFLSLLTIALDIALLVKAYVNLQTSDELAGAMNYIYENLNTVPFADITVAESSCPAGYTVISNLGTWGGTFSFCYDGGEVKKSATVGSCINFYGGISSQNYASWKNIKLCGQAVTGFSNSSQCSASQRSCYTGVCVTGTSCPITELTFSTSSLSSSGWTSVAYNGSFYINYRQDSSTLPLSTFRINIGESKSCLSSQEYSLQQSSPVNNINGDGCSKHGAFPNSKTVDNDNALSIFSSQSWSTEALTLPGYADLLKQQAGYLTASPRIQLASSCSSMGIESLRAGGDSLKTIRSLTTGFGAATLGAISLPLFVGLVVPILLCFVNTRDRSSSKFHCKSIIKLVLFGFFLSYPSTAVVVIIAAVLARSSYGDFEPYFSDYQMMTQNQCFVDGTVSATVQQFIDATTAAKSIHHLWIGLAVPYWVVFVFWIVVGWKYFQRRRD